MPQGPDSREANAPTRDDAPLVAAIVLTYNNVTDTGECLRSLQGQGYPRQRLIVVDNGSQDGSGAKLQAEWGGQALFIENRRNLGVAAGYNTGIRAALDLGADYVVLCNNDIVVEPGFTAALLGAFEANPEAGIVCPVILYYDQPDRIWFARTAQHPRLFYTRNPWRARPFSSVPLRLGDVYSSAFVPTCATMISRHALETVGLLDERFFFGHDDVDWCLRARRRGFDCAVVARPLVRHKVSVTAGTRGRQSLKPASAYTHAEGSVLIGAKHFRRTAAVPFLAGLLALRLPVNVYHLARSGDGASILAYLRGLWAGFRRYGRGFLRAPDVE